MSKEYFTENLSVEDIAELTDEMLRFEKNQKAKKITMANVLKIMSAVAAIVLVIGGINILPGFLKNTGGPASSGGGGGNDVNAAASATDETSDYINIPNFTSETTTDITTSNIDESDGTITQQMGELTVTTPQGQEPVDNGDGTATLPAGGTVIAPDGTKVTVPSCTVIITGKLKIDPTHSIVNDIIDSTGKGTVTVIYPNGSTCVFDSDGDENTTENTNESNVSYDDKVAVQVEANINSQDIDAYAEEVADKAVREYARNHSNEYSNGTANTDLNDIYWNDWLTALNNWLAINFNWNDRHTQVGDLIIQTPDGQSAIKNPDGTTTLPGGGTVIRSDGTKLIFPSGAVLAAESSDEIIDNFDGFTLRVELPNGNIIITDGHENTTINGENMNDVVNNMMNEYYSSTNDTSTTQPDSTSK
ncbi:MAG: hypothetical protein FWD71_23400 [Oscillospiraceae bacterium]|nr:hypothetical protein [Oscillospiraceae bacterium]